ncbi:MAG: glucose-6-phosphate dehydrogenase, partial [Armatimonadetes bacterium]|nr:glucose-6-phosphate dehydrogenase [Armatimonadota bacterium]
MGTEKAPRHLFVVMGGTGDLMSRKLLPALWHLVDEGYLYEGTVVLAVGRRTSWDDASYQAWARKALEETGLDPEGPRGWCTRCLHYHGLGEGTE